MINNITAADIIRIKIKYPKDVYYHITSSDKVIGFDETQFFEKGIENVVNDLLLKNKNVVISGLDMDAKKNPFGSMDYFLREADYVKKLTAACAFCRGRARYTALLIESESQILVGDEPYSPRCRKHYTNPEERTEK